MHILQLRCILSSIYIKPQQNICGFNNCACCILSSIYIKPQPVRVGTDPISVVSYQASTSNHNYFLVLVIVKVLYLIKHLHQTTTASDPLTQTLCCILSSIYIKPQPFTNLYIGIMVVSYQASTSNHNYN